MHGRDTFGFPLRNLCLCCALVSRAPAVGTNTSSSMAADVEFSREDMWLFSRVSISCRVATLNLSRELSA